MNLTRKSSWTRFMSNSTQLLVQRVADAAHDPTAWDGPAPGVLAVACSAGTTYTRSITAPSGSKHGAKSGSGLRGQPNSASTPSETSPADLDVFKTLILDRQFCYKNELENYENARPESSNLRDEHRHSFQTL